MAIHCFLDIFQWIVSYFDTGNNNDYLNIENSLQTLTIMVIFVITNLVIKDCGILSKIRICILISFYIFESKL